MDFHNPYEHGFVRVAAATFPLKLVDPGHNVAAIIAQAGELDADGVRFVVFPEMCLVGYSIEDLVLQDIVLDAVEDLERRWERELAGVEFAVEDVPWVDHSSPDDVVLDADVLDDGSVFSLDTDYVIGRDPSQDPDVQAGTARALRFDDAEGVLSRRHARVVLSDWTVQVVDLGSANGTGVWGPGDNGWHQIPPRTPIPLRPGTQIGFGRRNLRYESHRNT